jgi:hypothetical protein
MDELVVHEYPVVVEQGGLKHASLLEVLGVLVTSSRFGKR